MSDLRSCFAVFSLAFLSEYASKIVFALFVGFLQFQTKEYGENINQRVCICSI